MCILQEIKPLVQLNGKHLACSLVLPAIQTANFRYSSVLIPVFFQFLLHHIPVFFSLFLCFPFLPSKLALCKWAKVALCGEDPPVLQSSQNDRAGPDRAAPDREYSYTRVVPLR
jgi:hypothetical protein